MLIAGAAGALLAIDQLTVIGPQRTRHSVHWSLIGAAGMAVATPPFDGQGYPGSLPFQLVLCGFALVGFGREVWRLRMASHKK